MSVSKRFLFALGFTLLGATVATAQNFGARLLYTVGTTTEHDGERWGYLLWQATSPDLFDSKDFAIYAKRGPADSGSSYERISVVSLAPDPVSVQTMLQRGAAMGDDLDDLDGRLDEIFQDLLPPDPNTTTAEKLSLVVQGAMVDPELFENVRLLARLYASVNLCLGHAWAGPLPYGDQTTTFEIRQFDIPSGQDVRVIGRVTVESQAPDPLPAPGRPHKVPFAVDPESVFSSNAKGHLNARLRWSTPDDLRRLALLQYGYNVYRVPKDLAEQRLNLSNPDDTTFYNLIDSEPDAVEVNRLPVITDRDLDAAEAADTDDTDTFYFADDNERFEPGGEPFVDGEQFYYFVAARDILGRAGEVSPGTLVTMCDRMPPAAARRLEVENVYEYGAGSGEQFLRVSWEQPLPDDPERIPTHYLVYRWSSVDEMQKESGIGPAHQMIGQVAADPSELRLSFDDRSSPLNPNAPTAPADNGTTYWYTVRAGDSAACGDNLSGNSPPAWGVLRDREGPGAPTGRARITCEDPVVTHINSVAFDLGDDLDAETGGITRLNCTRLDEQIAWAEFYTEVNFSDRTFRFQYGRARFRPGQSTVTIEVPEIISQVPVFCRVGTATGKESPRTSAVLLETLPKGSDSWNVNFEAETLYTRTLFGGDCDGHVPFDPVVADGLPDLNPLDLIVDLTPGTKEWKIYRRVNEGELSLIAQGEADYDEVTEIEYADDAMPRTPGSTICYYGQLFDEHGNPSPLTRIDCVPISQADLPRPMLASIEAVPPDTVGESPQATIEWFCPMPGVERFELWFGPSPDSMPKQVSAELSQALGGEAEKTGIEAIPENLNFKIYQTQSLEAGFGDGDARFSATVDVDYGKEYTILVRAVGEGAFAGRPEGPFSNFRKFKWNPPETTAQPEVPWPARGLESVSPVDEAVEGNLAAVQRPNNEGGGVAIRVGEFTLADPRTNGESAFPVESNTFWEIPEGSFFMRGKVEDAVYKLRDRAAAESDAERQLLEQSIFPFAVYRYQKTSDAFPEVSGTIAQVTPKMESIAHKLQYEAIDAKGDPSGILLTRVLDPFFKAELTGEVPASDSPTHEIFLVDNHPVMLGATYCYLLVRFTDFGEIDRIIPLDPITISSNP
ncbi:MAG: hypothetical protein ACFB21_07355 [Opitutales bacterium]